MPRRTPPSIAYRRSACESITSEIGVYALCDLDGMPIYVGQSVDGIRARVRRHLTSARSDIIANRQVDIWEAAYVLAWPAPADAIGLLEAAVFHLCNDRSQLMNGSVPPRPPEGYMVPEPAERTQVMSDEEIRSRLDPAVCLPRQIEHYGRLVDHFLTVKDSAQISLSMDAHFQRLARYHGAFLNMKDAPPTGSQDAQDR